MLAVFDLDGCLLDTLQLTAGAINRVRAKHELAPLTVKAVSGCMGGSTLALLQRALPSCVDASAKSQLSDEKDYASYQQAFLELTQKAEVYECAHETLSSLIDTGWTLAVLSNRDHTLVTHLLSATGLSRYFHGNNVLGFSARFRPKPSPDALLHLMLQNRHTPLTTVMIGDSDVDSQIAASVGCRHIGCLYGYGSPQAIGDVRMVDTLAQVPAVLAAW